MILNALNGGWSDSAIDHNINLSRYNSLAGGGYIELPKKCNCKKRLVKFNILMIMNALNGVWSDSYAQMIQQESERLTHCLKT